MPSLSDLVALEGEGTMFYISETSKRWMAAMTAAATLVSAAPASAARHQVDPVPVTIEMPVSVSAGLSIPMTPLGEMTAQETAAFIPPFWLYPHWLGWLQPRAKLAAAGQDVAGITILMCILIPGCAKMGMGVTVIEPSEPPLVQVAGPRGWKKWAWWFII